MSGDLDWPDDVEVARKRAAFVDQVLAENKAWRISQGLEQKEDLLGAAVDEIDEETLKNRDYLADKTLGARLGSQGPPRLFPRPQDYHRPEPDMQHAGDLIPDYSQGFEN